ncbi:MAG: SusC/RagA family TonB-linked outer membrane protein, partial [Gemmatimonadetes bacterium]|nr:SusC/RagA family TonB-linked outer membrane protein [Gemmatimonadota bacterium]
GTDVTGANNLGAGALSLGQGSGVNEWTLLSYLGRVNYSISDRYLLTVTGRYDGSSRFGANDKWGFFPSAAFGWRVSQEPFLREVGWLSDLKLRVSYGVTGNQEIGTLASLAKLRDFDYVFGTTRVIAYAPAGQASNPDLKWESTRQFNGGVDLAVLDSRVTLTADAYTGTTNDLLLEVPLPRTTGFTSRLRNVGSIRNRGLELALTTVNLERDALTWRTSFNVSMNRNEVIALAGSQRIFPAGARGASNIDGGVTNVVQIGHPVGAIFGYKTNGIWQTGEDFKASGDPNAAPGEWKYVDVNGDGRITGDDRTILGTAQPDFFGGLSNNVVLGPLSLDIFFQGSFGNEVANANAVFLKSVSTSTNEYASSFERWTAANPSNTVPRANLNRQRRLLDVYVEDASYIRLQNATLAYQVPEGLIPRADQARVYVSAQNLWTSTDYTGYDPEVSSYGGDASLRGVDFGQYPRSRTINIGVNLTF